MLENPKHAADHFVVVILLVMCICVIHLYNDISIPLPLVSEQVHITGTS